jgi:hypothetical protein
LPGRVPSAGRGRIVATITPTDTALRLGSHGCEWSRPPWSKKAPMAVDVDFPRDASGSVCRRRGEAHWDL